MVAIPSLWAPILLSAVLIFVASSIIHMFLGYHRADYRKMPNEDQAMATMRTLNLPPGDYLAPVPGSMAEMKTPAFQEKRAKGPIVLMTIMKNNAGMGPQLMQWFFYTVVVSLFAAYVAGRALPPGAPYLSAFRFAGTAAFGAYAMALPAQSIWYQKSWGTTFRGMFDGLVYGLLTGGAFGWLWPN